MVIYIILLPIREVISSSRWPGTRIGSQLNKTTVADEDGDSCNVCLQQLLMTRYGKYYADFICRSLGRSLFLLNGGSVVDRKFNTYHHNIFLHLHSFQWCPEVISVAGTVNRFKDKLLVCLWQKLIHSQVVIDFIFRLNKYSDKPK